MNLEHPISEVPNADAVKSGPIPFLGRENELSAFHKFVSVEGGNCGVSRLIVQGDSGSGKSYFVKEALYKLLLDKSNGYLCLYVDLSNDEFQSARLISSLLKLSLVPAKPDYTYPLSIPDDLTFGCYQRKSADRKAIGWNIMKGVSQAAATLLGLGDAVNTALKSAKTETSQPEEILAKYLEWVSSQKTVILVVDNYQFMNHEVRLSLEAVIQRIQKNIRFIVIDRTIHGKSEIVPPLQKLSAEDEVIAIESFSKEETRVIVGSIVDTDEETLETLASDVFTKTAGLAKDIEFCLKQYQLATDSDPQKADVLGLLATIDKLPLMHRQFLLVASMLDGGIHAELARNAVRRVGALLNDRDIDRVLTELIALEYLKLNTDTGDRIRAGHERIIQAMRELTTEEQYDDVRCSLVEEFAAVLEKQQFRDNEAYLLHCLIGLQTASELRQNLHFISRLVRTQYRQEQFGYLVNLVDEIKEILPLLPSGTITLLLDALQKSSAFERGLLVIRFLDDNDASGQSERQLYRYKFLTQLYQYEEAAKIANQLEKGPWTTVYRVNSMLALDKKVEAFEVTREALEEIETTEARAILLRNTITLFPPDVALRHLEQAAQFFTEIDSDFRLATIDTNRSFVYLGTGEFGEASRVLERSTDRMLSVGSREVYQAYFNSGILQGLSGRLETAIDTLNNALTFVPGTLLLDRIKIEMAITIFEFELGQLTYEGASDYLQKSLAKIRGIQMPYLRKTLEYNVATLNSSAQQTKAIGKDQLAGKDCVSIYLPYQSKSGKTLLINPSIHWRY